MSRASASAGGPRWRCGRCGRYLPLKSVRIDADGLPRALCPEGHGGQRVLALFGRPEKSGGGDPRQGKITGQERSLLEDDSWAGVARDSFLDLVRKYPAGTVFSINNVRERLDNLEVPPRSRGALFAAAIAAGLIVPLMTDGGAVPVTVQSTGRSAHLARVRVYRRTEEP